ncbi:MAG: 2'-5' RNA ligase family protein [Phenylobacterium sp.]|uniref:2'-5' RNA ligase family protein n=1 Tax=Phenylobacterium sp. TaxID=1871053 RepID=UPI002722AD3E|nr:2'-5' RNA ligase family protein [Phenylobacterium sp.]MDO8900337.1 2'-5' RNA ligase family protein [Phenylobacterium sp.]
MTEPPPLIITAALDEGAFDWFDDLRQAHFPRNRNLVPAHLTLFHALPGDLEPRIAEILKTACAARTPMRLAVRGPWFIGRGVAYRIASPELEALRADLALAFAPWLTPQDRAPFRPHITIQNKADPAEARALCERLQLEFEPFDITAEGLLVWRYLGGPWAAVAKVGFGGQAATP